MSRNFKWTMKQRVKLDRVVQILEEFKAYKPLTLRQVYYQLVGKGFIENKVSQYVMLSGLLKWARIDGYIAWSDIEDRVRTYHNLTGWGSAHHYTYQALKYFLEGYHRNLMQGQNSYIEIWIEKDALSSIFTKIAEQYTVPVTVCKGFSSISFLNDFKKRLEYRPDPDQYPIMLYFGDFDPSGMEMLESMEITLRDELEVDNLEFKRIALLEDDIYEYELPHDPSALKRKDPRAEKHLNKYGELAVELDALRPDILESKIEVAIKDEIDMGVFQEQLDKEEQDLEDIRKLKTKVTEIIEGDKE